MTQKESEKSKMKTYQEIEALIDGELDSSRAKKIMQKIKNDTDLETHYQQLIKQKELLKKWWNAQFRQ